MNNFRNHQKLVDEVADKFEKEGFEIEGEEVPLGIVINKQNIRADLLVSKDGEKIPVECGHLNNGIERATKIKEKYGVLIQISWSKSVRIYQTPERQIKQLSLEFSRNKEKTSKTKDSKQISVRLPIPLYEKLKQHIEANDRLSQSEYIRTLLQKKIGNNPIKIKCQHCGYEWWTQSTLQLVTCPSCSKKTKNSRLEEENNG